jgi:hypothetical protein
MSVRPNLIPRADVRKAWKAIQKSQIKRESILCPDFSDTMLAVCKEVAAGAG